MKKIFFLVSFLFTGLPIFSQVSDGPKEVTPELTKKINAEVEKQILLLKSALEKRKVNKTEIEFTLDTARIEIFMGKYTAYDNSDFGLNTALYEAKEKYDKLLNKYYQKLMSVLKGEDKQVLTQSQRAWMTFRDNEIKLIETLTKDEYSGGGTVQRLVYSSQVFELTRKRMLEIYAHYNGTLAIE